MRVAVPEELAGERADRAVAVLAGVSRASAHDLVRKGSATFDGAVLRPAARVPAGAMLDVEIPAAGPALVPEDVPFEVVYEDAHVAVVDKPVGVVVHPGAGRRTGTLAAGILRRWPRVEGVGEESRWGIVHRLDRDTSGLMVVALTAQAFAALSDAVRWRLVERRYVTLVRGHVAASDGTVDAPLARDPSRRGLFRVDPTGRHAVTHYHRAAVWPAADRSLLDVTLETGRTHQIRVHLAAIGHPVVGDRLYGRRVSVERMFLHAATLGFAHPVTAERIDVESPMPAPLAEVVHGLGAPSPA